MISRFSPFFSVVIPAFNRGPYVAHAVQSVLDQNFGDFELVVVDDGSTDNTAAALQPFASRAKLVHQPNRGVSAARNRGVAETNGRWLAFLDSDDRWQPSYLGEQHQRLVSGESVIMQCADCHIHLAQGQIKSYFDLNGALTRMQGQNDLRLLRPLQFVARHAPWQIGSTVIDALAFRQSGGFDESLAISEDLDLLARIALIGPARFTQHAHVDILRRDEPFDSLSIAADRAPLRKRLAHDAIYAKLAGLPGLNGAESAKLRNLRSANRRAIGSLLRDQGNRAASIWAFWEAFCLAPSTRSLGKLCLSVLP